MTGTAFSIWPTAPRVHPDGPPRAVRVAFAALIVALLAGVAEAIVRAFPATDAANLPEVFVREVFHDFNEQGLQALTRKGAGQAEENRSGDA